MDGYRKIERTSVPDQIFSQLKESIIAGKWAPGDSLPSELQLAEEFGVSRMSVRAALKKLETFGLVEVRMGEGTFVIEFDPAVFLKGLSPMFSKPASALEILEFRKALEIECLKLGIKRASDHDIAVLESLFQEYWKALVAKDAEKQLAYDYRMHHQIFIMSKNSLFKQIYESLHQLFFVHIDENSHLYIETYGAITKETDEHAQVLEAMKRRDVAAAVASYTQLHEKLVAVYEKQNTGAKDPIADAPSGT
jgi:GntR family transcriptional regulator, transcriptional repressor for pyruvate dehydrogenase complex